MDNVEAGLRIRGEIARIRTRPSKKILGRNRIRTDFETGSGSDHILKTGSGTDLILKTGSGPDQQPYQLESKLQLPVPNSYDGKLQQLQKEIDSRLDDNTPAGF